MPLNHIDIAALVAGKREAWEGFIRAAAPLVLAAVRRALARAGRNDEAEDVVQQVFERLCREDFRLLRTYDPGRAKLSTWLSVVANSTALDHLRRLQRVPEPREILPEAENPEPPSQRDPLPIPRNLLTARQASIMALLYEQELDVSDVAELLGITEQTVRSAHHKAITRLRGYFAEEFPELSRDESPPRGVPSRSERKDKDVQL
ncbi:MAG TPA: sigma-70 family RNA polymerase sigma factor [Kiloniellales bacterium]|jgi:RNA polymerase sigma factor (sigma-70 family)|nr:sigma-70 family RNA polymerase sigma factor [Kiloniellales bacterium]